uniref:Uncharacterized protein n=1 Tax=Mus spicilegus TaxID=10103 RepID=A0A8C6G6B9_MUSSI
MSSNSNKCFKCKGSSSWHRQCPTVDRGQGHRMRSHSRGFQYVPSSLSDMHYHCVESGYIAKDCNLQEYCQFF